MNASRLGTPALLALLLTTSACNRSKDNSPMDAAIGQPQPAPDLSVPDQTPADAAVVNPQVTYDLANQQATQDLANQQTSTDMAMIIPPPPPLRDVTFYVVADTHADPAPNFHDLKAQAHAINAVAQNGQWPTTIDGMATNFVGGKIAPPQGVVFVGDLTGWGTAPTEIASFRYNFEQGNSGDSINYPAYLGLGNHDIDTADRAPDVANAYRAQYWAWIDSRHNGPNAPVPVGNFDSASHSYSFDFADVHFVQVHRFAGDVGYGLPSSLDFLKADLAAHAADGRPVFLFHHYGMDAFGTNGQWWNDADRTAYRDALRGYNVSGIFTGHTHAAFQYTWQGLRVFQVNNAKAEINTGNNDGNGSFAIVRITDKQLDVVTCRWLDDQGNYELISPFFSNVANPGPAARHMPLPKKAPRGE